MANAIVDDPVFGSLRFNAGLNWYEGTLAGKPGTVPIAISLDAQASAEAAIGQARTLLPEVLGTIEAAKAYACERLLPLKNKNWLESGEAALSPVQFTASLSIRMLGSYADQECELFFEAGSVFWGHAVLLSWNPTAGFYDATIAG